MSISVISGHPWRGTRGLACAAESPATPIAPASGVSLVRRVSGVVLGQAGGGLVGVGLGSASAGASSGVRGGDGSASPRVMTAADVWMRRVVRVVTSLAGLMRRALRAVAARDALMGHTLRGVAAT